MGTATLSRATGSADASWGGAVRRGLDVRGVVLMLLLLGGSGGCGLHFRSPPQPHAASAPATTSTAPGVWTLPPPAPGDRLYERMNILQRDPELPALYARRMRRDRQLEGRLIEMPLRPLQDYLRRPDMTPEQARALPTPPFQNLTAVVIELETPLPLYPSALRLDRAAVDASPIRRFHRSGYQTAEGTIEREVIAEGSEDVICPAGTFRGCKRIRVELRLRFLWGPNIDVTEYIWLADRLGEVRRIEHIQGCFFVFFLESAYQYSLLSFEPAADSRPAVESPRWSRILATFDKVFPNPSLGGLCVEFAEGDSER